MTKPGLDGSCSLDVHGLDSAVVLGNVSKVEEGYGVMYGLLLYGAFWG